MPVSKRLALCFFVFFAASGCTIDTAPTDLREVDRSSNPNDALACPATTCKATADIESPVFEMQAGRLASMVRQVISAQVRTELVAESPELNQLVFVQRSQLFGFPDTIWIQTVDLDPNASIVIYSRSNYGFWDLGVNEGRLRDWLHAIESAAVSVADD